MPLMEEFKKLLMEKAKSGESMDDKEVAAKMGLLDSMDNMMDEIMVDNLKKITIAAPDKEGLKEGLEKAEETLEEMPDEEVSPEKLELIKKLIEAKKAQEMKEPIDPQEAGLGMLEGKLTEME